MQLQTSGLIALDSVASFFGDSGDSSGNILLNRYYRGGPIIPTQKTINNSGTSYGSYTDFQSSQSSPEYYWSTNFVNNVVSGNSTIKWNGSTITTAAGPFQGYFKDSDGSGEGYEYDKGSIFLSDLDSNGTGTKYLLIRRRTYRDYNYTIIKEINTDIPSSGKITLADLYGAEKLT